MGRKPLRLDYIRCPDSFRQFQELVDHFEEEHRAEYDRATNKQLDDLTNMRINGKIRGLNDNLKTQV